MNTFKIKVHSAVDLITNSSTVIYTYSEGSLEAVKGLVNEMLKVFGIEETFDNIFYAGVLPDEYSDSVELPDNYEELEIKYIKGEIEKQDWMQNIAYGYYGGNTSLHLIPKDEKYSELANRLLKYLYSTEHEAGDDS
jgi:hypothetical protein